MRAVDTHVVSITNLLLFKDYYFQFETRKRLGSVCASNARALSDPLYASQSKTSSDGFSFGHAVTAGHDVTG